MQERTDYGEDKPSHGTAGESTNPAQATPPIGDEGEPGQTAVPAPDDDVGVPAEDELSEEE